MDQLFVHICQLSKKPPVHLHKSAQVSLANLLWAAALAQVSAEVQQCLVRSDKVFGEVQGVELVRVLWALGRGHGRWQWQSEFAFAMTPTKKLRKTGET